MSDEGNLVLGTAWKMNMGDVRVFVESLRRHYQGEAAILVASNGSKELVQYLLSRGILSVYFDCPFWMVMQVQLGRYVRYEEILRGARKTYDHVLLTDVTDVLFQANPFDDLPEGELLCFLEGNGGKISDSADNARWIKQIYGDEAYEKIKDRQSSCSGTTIGSHRAITRYLDLLLSHAKPEILVNLQKYRGHDQGIHNYLLQTGALAEARLIPNGQHVYTLGLLAERTIKLGPAGKVLTPTGRLCPIVHQFNYHPTVLEHVKSAFAA